MAVGLRYLRRHRVLWPLTAMGFGFGVSSGAVMGLLVVYAVDSLGLPDDDARLGWLYTATGIGSLISLALLPRLARRVGQLRLILLVRWVDATLLAGVITAPVLWVALPALAAWHGASSLGMVASITLRQQLIPDHLQGRVNTTARMIANGGVPLGAALGGAFAEVMDVRLAMLVMGGGALAALAWGGAIGLRGIDQALVTQMIADADHADQDHTDAPAVRPDPRPPNADTHQEGPS